MGTGQAGWSGGVSLHAEVLLGAEATYLIDVASETFETLSIEPAAGEQAEDGNVLIDIGPVNALAATDEAPVGAGQAVIKADFDGVEALAEDSAALWARVGGGEFLSDAEKRAMLGIGA
ncbi:hypothetical protein [uncultured Devosia sp.]|uniref:hypothetical protein n=1 Tax=uncultured Devosia sp. TaxID=211434 RepID=UPI0035CC6A7C